jgi:hypothetical protein
MCWDSEEGNAPTGAPGSIVCGGGFEGFVYFPVQCDLVGGNCTQCNEDAGPEGPCQLGYLYSEGVPASEWPFICKNVGQEIEILPGCTITPETPSCPDALMDCANFNPDLPGAVCYHITGDMTEYYGQLLEIPCDENVFYSLGNLAQCGANAPTTAQLCGWMTEDMNAVGCPLPPNPPCPGGGYVPVRATRLTWRNMAVVIRGVPSRSGKMVRYSPPTVVRFSRSNGNLSSQRSGGAEKKDNG